MTRIRQYRSVLWTVALLAAVVSVLLVAPDAMAQAGQETKTPPTPSSSSSPPLLIQYAVLAVLALGIVGLGVLKSKREVRN